MSDVNVFCAEHGQRGEKIACHSAAVKHLGERLDSHEGWIQDLKEDQATKLIQLETRTVMQIEELKTQNKAMGLKMDVLTAKVIELETTLGNLKWVIGVAIPITGIVVGSATAIIVKVMT